MTRYLQVFTTVPKKKDADRIALLLTKRKLSACTQIAGPVTSTYRWKGRVERSKEWLIIAKTTRRAYPKLEKAVKEAHPYELPEIIATPITAGSKEYLVWVGKEVAK